MRIRPSDEGRAFPVDIAVFGSKRKIEDDLFLVVECKKKNRKDGVAQLKLYMDSRVVRELVEEILEGGKAAFEMRRLKYGF